MGRSSSALKQLRKAQKAKKRKKIKLLKSGQVSTPPTCNEGEGKSETGEGRFKTGEESNPGEQFSDLESGSGKQSQSQGDVGDAGCGGSVSSNSGPSELTIQLQKVKDEAALYCQDARLERIRADRIEEDCKLRMKQVRCFWRDKIYRECTRSGKMLKKAIQGPAYIPR